jgi:general secretion pathway protein F
MRVRAFDPASGQIQELSLDAPDIREAQQLLAERGWTLISATQRAARKSTFSGADVATFATDLARLLRAGLTIPEALQTQSARAESRLASTYRRIHDVLQQGKPLSDALAAHGGFPSVLIAAVRASERSGRVAEALEEYARYDVSIRSLRRKAVSAAVYPVTVIAFGGLVCAFLLGYVVPRFAGIFADTAAHVSGPTRVLLAFGQLINAHAAWVALGLAVGIALVVQVGLNARLRHLALTSLLRLPALSRGLRRFQMARIAHAMDMLLGNGFPVPDAMQLAAALAQDPTLVDGMRGALEQIETGRPVSDAWHAAGLADGYAKGVLLAGERTGNLGACFHALADVYRTDVETQLERVSRVVEPVLLMGVASLIGLIVVLMYMPIFDLASSLG